MRRHTWIQALGVLCLAAVASGCGDPKQKLHPVTGTVTYRGEAVQGAVVAFQCDEPRSMATATTDAQGKFKLATFQSGEGAVAGKHKATVKKTAAPAAPAGGSGMSMEDAAKSKSSSAAGPKNELPARYADPAQSGLEYTVVAGPNDFKIELKD